MESISDMNTEPIFPHIGNLLNNFLVKNRRSPSALSRKLGIRVNSVLKIRKKETIQVALLWKISTLYKHNFIADVAAQLPSFYTGAIQDIIIAKDKEIAEIKNELFLMTRERDIYKDLLKR